MKRQNQAEQKTLLTNDFVRICERIYPDYTIRDILILSPESKTLCTLSHFPIFTEPSYWAHYAEEQLRIPIDNVRLDNGKLFLEGSARDDTGPQWRVTDEIALTDNLITIKRRWTYLGDRRGGVRLGFDLLSDFSDLDYWMIPGVMYNGNPGARCQPTGMLKDGEPWCFREERTPVPSCIILESHGDVVGFFTEPSKDEDHLSFCSLIPSEEGHIMRIGFPFIEAPLVYIGDAPGDHRGIYVNRSWLSGKTLVVERGDSFERTFYLVVGHTPEASHGYIKVLDTAWTAIPDRTRSCCDLDALHKICWTAVSYHEYKDENVSGYSTRISNKGCPQRSRSARVDAGWCGVNFLMGYLLMKEFINTNNPELLSKAKAIAASFVNHAGLSNGMYLPSHGIVKREFIEQTSTTLQMAEGIYWLLKMNTLLSEIEAEDETWKDFARKFCDWLVTSQLSSGSFGEKWHPSGELVADYRCGGVYAVATLAEAFKALGDKKYLESAEKGARYYIASCVDEESNYGICTDLSDTAIEKDGVDAVVFALLELYEVTKNPVYLDKAIKAAEFGLSFQYVYNIPFSSHTDAGKYNLDTRGGTLVTNEVPILGYWAAWAANSYLRIWKYTGDQRWRERGVSAIKHTTHLITTKEDSFGCAPHLIGCRDEVITIIDIARVGVLRKKGMVAIAEYEPVFWPAAFNLLNILEIREKYPELIQEFETSQSVS